MPVHLRPARDEGAGDTYNKISLDTGANGMQAFFLSEDTYGEKYGRHAYEIGWITDDQETP